jgi:hypothetical protein
VIEAKQICRDAKNAAKPCQFAGDPCHELRQRIRHDAGERGPDCSFFIAIMERRAAQDERTGIEADV